MWKSLVILKRVEQVWLQIRLSTYVQNTFSTIPRHHWQMANEHVKRKPGSQILSANKVINAVLK